MQHLAFKVVLLGETNVGKSCIATRFVKGEYNPNLECTIGAAFLTHNIYVEDHDVIVKLEIWDTAGQERYHSLAPMYYRGAHAALIVYGVDDRVSFERAKLWANELDQHTAGDNIHVTLVGNKVDEPEKRDVASKEALDFAEANRLYYKEASAKSGEGVREIFNNIALTLVKNSVDLKQHADSAVDIRAAGASGAENSESWRFWGCC